MRLPEQVLFSLKAFFAVLAVLFFLFGCLVPSAPKDEALILRVVDGDTVELFGGQTVRLIGINSAERGEECFEEAKQELKTLVEGKTVLLERDVEGKDRYGRALAYIYLGDLFVNLEMVENGNAFAYEFEPNTRHSALFESAQERARDFRKGCLWQEGSPFARK